MALTYEVVAVGQDGKQRERRYASEIELGPGDVLRIAGRDWLVERVEPGDDRLAGRLVAKPARYRMRLLHPDGREELGAFRRFRPDAPRRRPGQQPRVDVSPRRRERARGRRLRACPQGAADSGLGSD